MEELKELEGYKKSAFFYKNAYYLLPEGYSDFAEFQKNFCDGKSFNAVRLFERKCQAPYFVIENSEEQEVAINEKVYSANVYLMTQKEYNQFLRLAVEEKCGGCPNFGSLTESDESLIGHHEEISLKKVCYFREMAEKKYKGEFADFSDYASSFINNIVGNLYRYEELIDSGKTRQVKKDITEEFWQNFSELDAAVFVGKKEYSSEYYFYYSSNMDSTKALVMRVVFAKLQEIAKERNWEIKDYIPKGFFPNTARKPKSFNWKEVEFERKYYMIQFDEADGDNIDKYMYWLYGALGEDTFRSFCECIDVVKDLKTDKKVDDFVREVETYGETLKNGVISFPQAVVSMRSHGDGIENMGICTTLSSSLMDYTNMLENDKILPKDWYGGLYMSGALPIYRFEFNLKEKIDFSNPLQSTQNEDIDTMVKTTNYLKENLIGTLFTFELMHDKFLVYGILFNLAKFKMAVNYLKPLLSEYNTKVTIFTNSNKKGEDFDYNN